MTRRLSLLILFVMLATLAGAARFATPAQAQEDTTPKIVAAANAFLATLSDTEKATVLFDWTDTAQKQRWSNLPEGLYSHDGLMWGNMTAVQREAWLGVMAATLSVEGYDRVIKEWNADEALAVEQAGQTSGTTGATGGVGQQYGTQYYFIAIIGTPSTTDAWQWQWGGHHVTVNATIVGSSLSLAPSFIGDQPSTYTDVNGNIVRPLGDIESEAFALVNALDDTQQAAAVLGSTSIDLVLGPGQDGKVIASEGLPASQMTAAQQQMFLTLIGEYTNLENDEDAASRKADIESHLADTYFAWYGPTAEGSSAYFRVTGPTIVIEYAPQGALGGGGAAGGAPGTGGSNGTPRAGGPNGTPGAGGFPGGTPGTGGGALGGGSAVGTPVYGATPGTGAVGTPGAVSTAVATTINHVHGIYRDPTNDYGAALVDAGIAPAATTTTSGAVATATTGTTGGAVATATAVAAPGMPITGGSDGSGILLLAGLAAVLITLGAALTMRLRTSNSR